MKIAIVKLTSLGDVVFASFIPQLIKQIYGQECTIDWFCDSAFTDVIKGNTNINNIISLPIRSLKKTKKGLGGILQTIKLCKKNQYNIVVDFQGTLKSAIVSALLRGKNTTLYGFSWGSAREGLASIFYNKKYKISYKTNIVERNLGLFNFVFNQQKSIDDIKQNLPSIYSSSVEGAEKLSKIYVNSTHVDEINKLKLNTLKIIDLESVQIDFAEARFCLLVPFSSNAKKDLSFKEIAKIVSHNKNIVFIINYGSQQEAAKTNDLILLCKQNNLHNVTTFSSSVSIETIKQLCLLVCHFVIGCDSGITHLANFCGLKTHIIFKESQKKHFEKRNVFVNTPLDNLFV